MSLHNSIILCFLVDVLLPSVGLGVAYYLQSVHEFLSIVLLLFSIYLVWCRIIKVKNKKNENDEF